jgi:rod shape-determining protein MreD
MEKKYKTFRYIAYAIEIVLLFVIQTTPDFLPEIAGAKPILLIPAALTVAFFEQEIPAMFFGLGCGVVLDLSSSNNIGFYAFTLTLICFVLSQIFRDYMVVSFLNSLAFSAVIVFGLIMVYFLFFYLIPGKPQPGYYFVNHYISRIVYTICTVPFMYWINKFLYRNLRD